MQRLRGEGRYPLWKPPKWKSSDNAMLGKFQPHIYSPGENKLAGRWSDCRARIHLRWMWTHTFLSLRSTGYVHRTALLRTSQYYNTPCTRYTKKSTPKKLTTPKKIHSRVWIMQYAMMFFHFFLALFRFFPPRRSLPFFVARYFLRQYNVEQSLPVNCVHARTGKTTGETRTKNGDL